MVFHLRLIQEICDNKNFQKSQKHHFGAVFCPFLLKTGPVEILFEKTNEHTDRRADRADFTGSLYFVRALGQKTGDKKNQIFKRAKYTIF